MVAVTKKKIPGPTSEIAAFTKKSQQLKLEADVLFAKGSHGEALAKYNKAQQLALSEGFGRFRSGHRHPPLDLCHPGVFR